MQISSNNVVVAAAAAAVVYLCFFGGECNEFDATEMRLKQALVL